MDNQRKDNELELSRFGEYLFEKPDRDGEVRTLL